MPSGKKRKRAKIAKHKRKKRLRKNRHKKKKWFLRPLIRGFFYASDFILHNIKYVANNTAIEVHTVLKNNIDTKYFDEVSAT